MARAIGVDMQTRVRFGLVAAAFYFHAGESKRRHSKGHADSRWVRWILLLKAETRVILGHHDNLPKSVLFSSRSNA